VLIVRIDRFFGFVVITVMVDCLLACLFFGTVDESTLGRAQRVVYSQPATGRSKQSLG